MTNVRDLLIYQPEQYIAEYELVSFLRDIVQSGCDKLTPVTDSLLHQQPQAVEAACSYPLSILTGAAGTGKSTTTRKIVESFEKAGMRVAVACPTGKAAKRSSEIINAGRGINNTTKQIPCTTIHRLLGFDRNTGGFVHNRANRFSTFDALIIDEYPFLGNLLARDLFEAIEPGQHRIVLCGDPNQLPPVDSGNLGRDLLDIDKIPSTRLDIVLRQGANSGIVQNANRVLLGKELTSTDPKTGEKFTDCFFTPTKSEEETLKKMLHWIKEEIPQKRKFDPVRDVQVICPGKKSTVGVANVNKELRELLNGGKKREALGFRLGDKVINNENNKRLGIVNGDVGIVVDMRVEQIKIGGAIDFTAFITVDFGDGAGNDGTGRVEFNAESASSLSLALSFTVHKSQGSEFPVVIAPLHMCHAMLLNRNLLYTLMTRPRYLLCMIGDPAALAKAIWNDRPSKRRTRLRSILNSMLLKGVA